MRVAKEGLDVVCRGLAVVEEADERTEDKLLCLTCSVTFCFKETYSLSCLRIGLEYGSKHGRVCIRVNKVRHISAVM